MTAPARRRSGGDEGGRAPRGWACGSLLLAVAVLGCSAERTLTASLAEELAGRRPFAGRLTVQPRATVGVEDPEAAPDAVVLGRLARDRVGGGELADGHLRGVLRLLVASDGKGLDEAVQHLVDAVEARPDDASLRTDLVVAYLARAERADRPEDRVAALAESRRAVELAPTAPATLYDRALSLDGLGLVWLATTAWKAFLAVEPTGVWADEARARLAVLEGPTRRDRWKLVAAELAQRRGVADATLRESISGYMQEAREHAMEELLPAWGAAVLAGEADAAAVLLEQSRTIGGVLVDQTVADTVASIDGATDEATRRRLAEGMVAYGEGRRLFAASDTERAREPLERSRERLESAGCPMWRWAEIWLAGSDLYQANYLALERRLPATTSGIDSRRWPVLHARAEWAHGLAAFRTGRLGESVAAHSDAVASYNRAQEREDHASALTMLAEAQSFSGTREAAWRLRAEALGILAAEPISARRHNILLVAAEAVPRSQRSAAADFMAEDAIVTERLGSAVGLSEAHIRHADVLTELGDSIGSAAAIALAREAAEVIPSEPLRRRAKALVEQREAELMLSGNTRAALAKLDRVLEYYQDTALTFDRANVLLARARAKEALSELDSAERDLAAAIREVEAEGLTVGNPETRLQHREATQDAFEAMVEFQIERRHDAMSALAFAEKARSLDSGREPRTEIGLEEWVNALPDDVLVAAYFFAGKRLYGWAIRRSSISVQQLPVAEGLPRRMETYRRILSGQVNDSSHMQLGHELFSELVEPLLERDPQVRRLVILPDRYLCSFPFGALRTVGDHRYLGQALSVSMVPRLNSIGQRRNVPLRARRGHRLLVVTNPALAPEIRLAPLPRAELAALSLAHEFGDTAVLSGTSATRTAVLRELQEADAAYFAVHSANEVERPGNRAILLAPEADGDDGRLESSDLKHLDLSRVRFVFLSGCDTAVGSGSRLEGLAAVAQALLDAGVRVVAGNLWPIEDDDRQLGLAVSMISSALESGVLAPFDPTYDLRTWSSVQTISAASELLRFDHFN